MGITSQVIISLVLLAYSENIRHILFRDNSLLYIERSLKAFRFKYILNCVDLYLICRFLLELWGDFKNSWTFWQFAEQTNRRRVWQVMVVNDYWILYEFKAFSLDFPYFCRLRHRNNCDWNRSSSEVYLPAQNSLLTWSWNWLYLQVHNMGFNNNFFNNDCSKCWRN